MKKKEIENKEITINDLARIVASGFEGTKGDIEKLALSTAKGFEEVSRDMARIENNLIYHIGSVNRKIDDMSLNKVKYEDHNKLKARVTVLEKNLK